MGISESPLRQPDPKNTLFKIPVFSYDTAPKKEKDKTQETIETNSPKENLSKSNLKTGAFPSIDIKFGSNDPDKFNGKISVGFGDYTKLSGDSLPIIGGGFEKVYLHKADLAEKKDDLLFNDFEISQLKQKINVPPYSSWWQNILGLANGSLNGNLKSQTMVEVDRSQRTEACALAYRITGEQKYLNAAKDGLSNIAPPNKYDGIVEGNVNQGGIRNGPGWQRWLETGPALQSYAYAFDLVKGNLETNEKNIIVNKLGTEANEVYKYLDLVNPNNWSVIVASGLGSVALALSDTSGVKGTTPQQWLDKAIDGIGKGFSVIERDGINREGAHYALYSNKTFLPFANSYYKTMGVNVLDNEKIRAMNDWVVKISKPGGDLPAIGDAWTDDPILTRLLINKNTPNAASYNWLYKQMPQALQDSPSDTKLAIESLAFFDKNVPVLKQPFENSTNFFPVGGETVFRSDWSKEAVYGLLLDHNKIDAHTHTDPGNFFINAYGKDLIIGAGYGPVGWLSPERSWYVSPEAHNVMLVDGHGPTDASQIKTMSNAFDNKTVAVSRTGDKVEDVDHTRTMYFSNNRYFVVVDNMESESSHKYDYVLHGKGDYHREDNDTVSWKNGDVEMITSFVEPKPLKILDLKGKVSEKYGKEELHTYIKAEKEGKSTQLVSILFPKKSGQNVDMKDENFVSKSNGSAKRVIDRANDLNDLITVSDGQNELTSGKVKTFSKFSLTSEDKFGALKSVSVEKGTSYNYSGKELFNSNNPLDITLNPEKSGEVHGYVNTGNKETEISLTVDAKPVLVMFQGRSIPFQYENGKVKIKVEGEGTLDIGRDTSVTSPKKSYRIAEEPPKNSILERLSGISDPKLMLYSLSQEELDQLESEIIQETIGHVSDDLCSKFSKMLGLDQEELKNILLNGYSIVNHIIMKYNLPFRLKAEQNFNGNKLQEEVSGNVTTSKKVNIDNSSVKYQRGDLEVGINHQNAEGKSKSANMNVRYGDKTDTDLTVMQDPDGNYRGYASQTVNIGDISVNTNIQGTQNADNGKTDINYKDASISYKNVSIQAKDSKNTDNISEREVKLNYKNENLYSSISARKNDASENLEVTQKNEIKINNKLNISESVKVKTGNKTEFSEANLSANYTDEKFSSSGSVYYNAENKEALGNIQANNKLNKNITLNNSVNTSLKDDRLKLEHVSSQSNFNYKPLNTTLNVEYNREKITDNDMISTNVNFGIPVSENVSLTTGQSVNYFNNSAQWGGMNGGISYSSQDFCVSSAIGYEKENCISPGGLTLDNNFSVRVGKTSSDYLGLDSHLLLNQGVREANVTLKVYDNKHPTPGLRLTYRNIIPGQEELELRGQVNMKF